MASLAILAAVLPASINGLSGSSLNKALGQTQSPGIGTQQFEVGLVQWWQSTEIKVSTLIWKTLATLQGWWDLFESDPPSPYNSLQSHLFGTFAAPLTKR